jgi:HAD superfamily, subfamily IIIB (Acid phosphatase)
MSPSLIRPSRRRPRSLVALAVAAVAASTVLVASGAADAGSFAGKVPPPPVSPTSANQIQNIDQVKTAIKAYYGDTPSSVLDPVSGTVPLHFASPTSAYANEMAGIESKAEGYLASRNKHHSSTKAIVLDIDDTTLNTYSYEIYSSFVYSPPTNLAFVNAGVFPAVFGMPGLVAYAQADGYAIFFITGRAEAQRAATAANLQSTGYPAVPDDQLFLKDQGLAWLTSCTPTCTTQQYKTLTRQHIESEGYDVVANFGDQFSDLNGGFADRTYKIPNPMYFIP